MNKTLGKHREFVSELTPGGRGAICVLHVQAPQVVSKISSFFSPASGRSISNEPIRKPVYGRWILFQFDGERVVGTGVAGRIDQSDRDLIVVGRIKAGGIPVKENRSER